MRKHRHRSLRALGATAAEVLDAVLRRCVPGHPGADPLTQFVPVDGDWLPDEQAVATDRPPAASRHSGPPGADGEHRSAPLRSGAMGSALVYVIVVGLVAAAVYLLAAFVFGRGEELAPMPPGATPTRLPARDLTAGDVRDLRFQQALRGYKCSEVDWALERLAAEVDALRARIEAMETDGEAPAATLNGHAEPAPRPGRPDAHRPDRDGPGRARAGTGCVTARHKERRPVPGGECPASTAPDADAGPRRQHAGGTPDGATGDHGVGRRRRTGRDGVGRGHRLGVPG